MNVVYIKKFENGKLYIGMTNDFERRMREHTSESLNDKKSEYNLPKSRAMRKYSHETEMVFESEDYDETLKMEVLIIQNFKDLGYELYNITTGGEGSKGLRHSEESREKMSRERKGVNNSFFGKKHSEESRKVMSEKRKERKTSQETKEKLKKRFSGENNHRAKPMEYWETNPTRRSDFKRTCEAMNWKFENFEEIFVGYNKHKKPEKIYTYKRSAYR